MNGAAGKGLKIARRLRLQKRRALNSRKYTYKACKIPNDGITPVGYDIELYVHLTVGWEPSIRSYNAIRIVGKTKEDVVGLAGELMSNLCEIAFEKMPQVTYHGFEF